MELILYQTLEDRGNPESIEVGGPFKCTRRDAWLGHGYYFWDGHIQLAHFWGRKFGSGYVVCKADAELDSKCWNLHGNALHRIELEGIFDILIEKKISTEKQLLVSHIIEFLKSKGEFKYTSIRALGVNSISKNSELTKRIQFHDKHIAYFDVYPPVQVCLIQKNALSLQNYSIVYPDYYTNDVYA